MINNKLKMLIGYPAVGVLLLSFVLMCGPSFAQQKGSQPSVADTFKLAGRYIAKKKFRKAARLYSAYSKKHPKDVNVTWKLAQTQFWLGNFRRSDTLYRSALKLAPDNDYLRLNYIHSLMDMGKTAKADVMLTNMELAGRDYSDMSTLRARLAYYQGDYRLAAAYMRKSLNEESNNADARELNDEIELARSPMVSLSSAYLSDNQPVTAIISTVKAENYFSRYADLYIVCDEYHFMQDVVSDAPWVRVGDKLFFPAAGLRIDVGAGVFKYPVMNEAGWSGNLSVNKKISHQFDIDAAATHTPYFDTKTSIDTDISVTRESLALNWRLRNWSAQAAILNSNFPGNTDVYGAYSWVLAPIVGTAHVQLLAGGSVSYSTSGKSSYVAQDSIPAIVANFATDPNVAGVYNPYFTPNQLFTTSVLAALNLYPSKKVSINLGGDIGYGSIDAPYLFLNKDVKGNLFIERGFATETFTPADAKVAVNYNIDKTWLLTAKYIYTNTYFFTSNYVSLGIQKTFLHHKKKQDDGTGSTFSRLIRGIEDEIQALYKSRDEGELRSNVAGIRSKLVTLRDTRKNRESFSEKLRDDEQDATFQDRSENLNEMIEEIDAVNLDDFKDSGKSKKEWMVDKLYDLTSITYIGNLD